MCIRDSLSGAILIMGAGAVMMLVGGIHWRWVGLAMGAAGLLLYLVLGVIGYNASRIEMWHNPWLDPQGAGYQLRQSLITIGSGGLWGVGLGKSRQKFLYLPEAVSYTHLDVYKRQAQACSAGRLHPSTEHPPRWDLCGRHPGTSRTLSGCLLYTSRSPVPAGGPWPG